MSHKYWISNVLQITFFLGWGWGEGGMVLTGCCCFVFKEKPRKAWLTHAAQMIFGCGPGFWTTMCGYTPVKTFQAVCFWIWNRLSTKTLALQYWKQDGQSQSLSLPSSPNLPEVKCIHDVVRISSTIILCLSKLWKAKFFNHTVLCNIPGEAAGEIWNWSISGVKGLNLCWCWIRNWDGEFH